MNHTLHGIFTATIYWSDLLTGILPIGSKGINVIFENECNPTFTFQVDGPTAEYLGLDDIHDPKYNNYEKKVSAPKEQILLWSLQVYFTHLFLN
jgi:hypothetical protein